jgi:hypothetical protein
MRWLVSVLPAAALVLSGYALYKAKEVEAAVLDLVGEGA